MSDDDKLAPFGRCTTCGYPIRIIIRRNTRFCSENCEEAAKVS